LFVESFQDGRLPLNGSIKHFEERHLDKSSRVKVRYHHVDTSAQI